MVLTKHSVDHNMAITLGFPGIRTSSHVLHAVRLLPPRQWQRSACSAQTSAELGQSWLLTKEALDVAKPCGIIVLAGGLDGVAGYHKLAATHTGHFSCLQAALQAQERCRWWARGDSMWLQSCIIIMVSPANGVRACWVLENSLHNIADMDAQVLDSLVIALTAGIRSWVANLAAEAKTAHTGHLLA